MPPVLDTELLVVVQVLIFPHIPYCFILRPARDLRSGRWHHRTDAVHRSLAWKTCPGKEARCCTTHEVAKGELAEGEC